MIRILPLLVLALIGCGKTAPPSSLGIRGMDRPEFKRHWGAGEVKHLPDILNKDEVVKYVVFARIQAVGNGLLVATDSRVLFVDKGRSGVTAKEFSYDKITYVSYKKDALLGKVFLFEDGYRTVFQGLSHDEAEGIARYIIWYIKEELGVDVSRKKEMSPTPGMQAIEEARSEERAIGEWKVSQERDPIDDSQVVIASLGSSNSVIFGTHRPANLYIRCEQGKTDVFVYWWHVISETEGKKEVTYRFPPQDAVEGAVWSTSTDRKATFVRINPIGFAREVGSGKRLVVRTEEVVDGHAITAQFELAGSREALAPVAAACGWALGSTYVGQAALSDPRAAPLVALYRATNGEGWTENSNWLSSRPLGDWFGVETNGRGEVIEVVLYGNGLRGTIPPELAELKELEVLALSGQLRGRIPPELGKLPRLRILTLSHNQLSGQIPLTLGELPVSLESLSLNGNRLTGGIPPELGQLSGLTALRLDENALTGEIPVELGHLRQLTELDLADNHLRGQIPPELGHLTELRKLYLAGNRLSGCIPLELIEMGVDLRRPLTGRITHDLSRIGLSTCPRPSGSLTSFEEPKLDAPRWKGIGVGRHAIQSIFEKVENGGFVFKSGRLPDGRLRALAYSDEGGVLIRLIGPQRDLLSAYVSARLGSNGGDPTPARVLQRFVLFVEHAAPNWSEGPSWLERNIPSVRARDAKIETKQGHLTIVLRHRDGLLSLRVSVPER